MLTMSPTPAEVVELNLTQRTQSLKHWVLDNVPDDDAQDAVLRLARRKADPENADIKHLQRILQQPSIPSQHVLTLLALLLQRRGGSVPDMISPGDEALLGRAVRKLAALRGLHECMMCFTGLFCGNVNPSDKLLGVREAATALLNLRSDVAREVAIELVQRVSLLVGDAHEKVDNILGGVVETILRDLVSVGNFGSIETALALEESTSLVPVTDKTKILDVFERSGLSARQFVWTYRAVGEHVRFMDRARELGGKIQKEIDELREQPQDKGADRKEIVRALMEALLQISREGTNDTAANGTGTDVAMADGPADGTLQKDFISRDPLYRGDVPSPSSAPKGP